MNLLALEIKSKRRRATTGPFAELDKTLAKYVGDLKATRAAVKKAGGAYVRMSQQGRWSCRMRLRKYVGKGDDGESLYESEYDRLEAESSAALLGLVKAWQAEHGKTGAPKVETAA